MTSLAPDGGTQIVERARMIRPEPEHLAEITLRLGILALVEQLVACLK